VQRINSNAHSQRFGEHLAYFLLARMTGTQMINLGEAQMRPTQRRLCAAREDGESVR
jgi:hypothetical protein